MHVVLFSLSCALFYVLAQHHLALTSALCALCPPFRNGLLTRNCRLCPPTSPSQRSACTVSRNLFLVPTASFAVSRYSVSLGGDRPAWGTGDYRLWGTTGPAALAALPARWDLASTNKREGHVEGNAEQPRRLTVSSRRELSCVPLANLGVIGPLDADPDVLSRLLRRAADTGTTIVSVRQRRQLGEKHRSEALSDDDDDDG